MHLSMPGTRTSLLDCEYLASWQSPHCIGVCLAWSKRAGDTYTNRREDGAHTPGPSPEAVRRSAARNTLPVARITEVRVLDTYFFN